MIRRIFWSKSLVRALLVACLTIGAPAISLANSLNKHEMTALYINTIAKAIEWPKNSTATEFKIGVVGDQNKLFIRPLSVLTKNTIVHNLPVTVEPVELSPAIANFNVIYIEGANSKLIDQFYTYANSNPVLLVTTEFSKQQSVMINLLSQTSGHMKFEVNKSNIINQGLNPLPDLILAGGTEIDVAKLFKDSQDSLILLGRELERKEEFLNALMVNILDQEKKNSLLEQKMAKLSEEINQSEKAIAEKNERLQISEANRLGLAQEVDLRTNQINNLKGQLVKIQTEINAREARVSSLNNTIKTQEREIEEQKKSIEEQKAQLTIKDLTVEVMWYIVGFVLILCAGIFISRHIILKQKKELEEKDKDNSILTKRLIALKKNADEASKSKGDFLSLMSHELRTPLQSIIGYSEVVIDTIKDKNLKGEVADLQKVIANSERLLKLINGILELAKIEAGRMPLDLTEVKISSLVQEALNTTKPLLKAGNNQITLDVNDGSFLPTADPEKIVTILVNLIGNSIKFTQNGIISVKAHHEANRLLIQISDTGSGIPSDKLTGIFDKFSQAKSAYNSGVSGNGLGLSIVKEMAECMGGFASVESTVGIGTKFTVSIPLPISTASQINTDTLLTSLPSNSFEPKQDDAYHVLVIDDDSATRDLIKRFLEKDGMAVHTAKSAESGYSLANDIIPDLIAIGTSLPDAYCLKLIERIKEHKILKDIPVIILSPEEGSAAEIAACDELIQKPIRHDQLRNIVLKLLTKN